MATNPLQLLSRWSGANTGALQGLTAPILVVAILGLMVLPVPPWMLDTFFTLNIALALMAAVINLPIREAPVLNSALKAA